jgi:alpha-D-xyloside xylohydrolase
MASLAAQASEPDSPGGVTSGSSNSKPPPNTPPGEAYLAITNPVAEGVVEARIYKDSGRISLAGPDLAANPLANRISFAPPQVVLNGESYPIGQVFSSTVVSNGLQLVQRLAKTNIVVRLIFTSEGVMRYEVVDWRGLPIEKTVVTAESSPGEHFYGFGEKFNQFDQAGKLVHILTFDKAGDKQDSSYKVVPWFLSTRGYGFYLDSSAESWFDMRAGNADRFVVTNLFPSLKFSIVYGPKLTEVLSRYSRFTGRPPTPPAWAFAPWLSSDIWQTGGQIRYAVRKYRASGIPGSVFVFDSPWEVSYNDFTWNMTQFGAGGTYEGTHYDGFQSSGDMLTFLRTNGFKVLCWMTPFINTDSTHHGEVAGQNLGPSPNYAVAATNNYFVRASVDGPPLISHWWKGAGSPVDFTNPKAREWLTMQLSNLVAQSGGVIGGFKTDDGESGSADGNSYIPTNAVYYDGRTGIEMRNGFSPMYEKTVWSVLGTNGILWARSGFTGSQAYPACWAGDNQPNFGKNGLGGVVVAGESAAMSGFAIWGSDIGGYQDGASIWSSTPANLFERWTQFGALSPIMQMHRQVTTGRQYPWSFGDEGMANYRFYARLHTALFPYLYTYAQRCSTNGLPMIRPLVLMNQTDSNTYGLRHTYLLGDELLAAVVVTNLATTRAVYLPTGNWYDFFTQQRFAGGQTIVWSNTDQTQMPLFAREGAIIPMIPTNVLSLCDSAYIGNPDITTWDGSLQFLIYPTANSSFTLYDGTSLQCRAASRDIKLSLSSKSGWVTLKIFTSRPSRVECGGLRLHRFTNSTGFASATRGWFYNGQFVQIKFPHAGGTSQIDIQGRNFTR